MELFLVSYNNFKRKIYDRLNSNGSVALRLRKAKHVNWWNRGNFKNKLTESPYYKKKRIY